MNKNNKAPFGLILWIVISCAIHIVLFRSKLDMEMSIIQRLLYVFLAVAVTLPVHEIIHCLFMKLFGLKGARIEFGKDPLGIPSLRAIAQGEISGLKRSVILLAPFLLLTLLPDILFCLNTRIPFLFFVVALSNAAGCYFDLMDIVRDIKYKLKKTA